MAERSFLGVVGRALAPRAKALSPVPGGGGWWPVVREAFAGAWQQNVEVRLDCVLANGTVFRCIGLISSDIAKMALRLVQEDDDGIWNRIDAPAFSPVLRKPNGFQNRIQFIENWTQSKLVRGNTYVLKQRDARGVVTAMYVLNPDRVTPMVADDGSIFYELRQDSLAGLPSGNILVPAREIIHDRWNCLFHPLVGLSPIFACGLAATQGLSIQSASTIFFKNGSRPGGVLTAPGHIPDDTAARLKTDWEEKFGGSNQGRVAILGDALKYEPLAMTAEESQLIDQLKWSDEQVCRCFGVPPFMAAVGAAPAYNNVEALAQQYYGQCLQIHIESIELCLDEGLGLDQIVGKTYGVEFDLDGLLRMDTATQVKTLGDGVLAGIYKPDEARARLNLKKVKGGDQVYLQQQNYSLEALAKRDAKEDPFASGTSSDATPTAPALPAPDAGEPADKSLELQQAEAKIEAYKALDAFERVLEAA